MIEALDEVEDLQFGLCRVASPAEWNFWYRASTDSENVTPCRSAPSSATTSARWLQVLSERIGRVPWLAMSSERLPSTDAETIVSRRR